VSLNEVPPTVAAEALNTPSGTVLYDSGLQPREATSAALSQSGARMDPAGTMTLGNASASTLTGQSNLRAMAASVARETGVARITLNRTATGWTFDGAINPTVFGLVTYTDKNPGLDGLMKDIERSVGLTNPDKEFLKSICREAARRFGAQVTFTDTMDRSVHPYRRVTEVVFSKTDPSGAQIQATTQITQVHSDAVCPACGVPNGAIGGGGSFSGPPGVSRPHDAINAAKLRDAIIDVLGVFGVGADVDNWTKDVVGVGYGKKGPATSENKQCTACENAQGEFTLLQRAGGAAPVGNQFQNATPDQLAQYVNDKIENIVSGVEAIVNASPGGNGRPDNRTHLINRAAI
jgi:hypothetical protein